MAQNLDKYFKEKLEHRTFEMKDAYWQQAAALLDAAEKKKKRAAIFWWSGGLLGLLVLAFVFFHYNIGIHEAAVSSDNLSKNKVAEITSIGNATENKPAQISTAEKNSELNISEKNTAKIAFNKKSDPGINKEKYTAIRTAEKGISEIKNTNSSAPKITEKRTEKEENSIFEKTATPAQLNGLMIFVESVKEEKEEMQLKNGNACHLPSPWHFGVTATQLMQTYPKSGENLVTGLHAGVIGQYDLNNNWFVAASLGYTRRDGHFEKSKTTETRMYRFGLELMEEELRPNSLHYATSTLSAGWKKGHHLLEAGFVLDHLMGVRGQIGKTERFNVAESELPVRDFVPREKGWIDEYGFTKFSASPMIGYRYRVNRALSFGLAMQYAVRPLTNKEPVIAISTGEMMGDYILKENDRFNLRLNAVYLLK